MGLDRFFRLGESVDIGSYEFTPESIKAFARKYDPQPFHVDEAAASKSVLGGLCASGWHTASAWMKCNVESGTGTDGDWDGEGPKPRFGPSPGFSNLKWLKPVHAGETVRYTRTAIEHRALASRPGWRVLSLRGEGFDTSGDKVLEFDSAVLVEVGTG